MGRKELLVTKVKRVFLVFLELMDIQAFLVSQETEVASMIHFPSLNDMICVFISCTKNSNAHRCPWLEGPLWAARIEGTEGSSRTSRYV